MALEAARFQMPKDPWPKDNAFNEWMSANANMREDDAGEHDALEVGFKAGFTAGKKGGGSSSGGGGGGRSDTSRGCCCSPRHCQYCAAGTNRWSAECPFPW